MESIATRIQLCDGKLDCSAVEQSQSLSSVLRVAYNDDVAQSNALANAGGEQGSAYIGCTQWVLSVAVEPEMILVGNSGPVQALQNWVTLFGVQDFESCLQDKVEDGRSKLLALVEDSLTGMSLFFH